MDEITFQKELANLKRQVASMSIQNAPQKAAPQNATMFGEMASERFTAQLRALNSHVLSLQSEFIQSWLSHHESGQVLPPVKNPSLPSVDETPEGQSQRDTAFLRIPPGRDSFDRLVASLERLDGRVANVERIVSDVEDKLDNMDPARFTPDGSDDGKSGGHIQRMDDLTELVHVVQDSFGRINSCINVHMHHKTQQLDPAGPATNGETRHVFAENPHVDNMTAADTYVTSVEGLRFRDREISRLEDLLRGTQQSLLEKEELIVEKDRMIQKLQCESAATQQGSEARPSFPPRTWGERLLQTKMVISQHAADLATRQSEVEREFASLQDDIKELVLSLHKERTAHSEVRAAKDEETKRLQRSHIRAKRNVSQQELLANRSVQQRDEDMEALSRTANICRDDLQHALREKNRCERLLEESNTEIARLRSLLANTSDHEETSW